MELMHGVLSVLARVFFSVGGKGVLLPLVVSSPSYDAQPRLDIEVDLGHLYYDRHEVGVGGRK